MHKNVNLSYILPFKADVSKATLSKVNLFIKCIFQLVEYLQRYCQMGLKYIAWVPLYANTIFLINFTDEYILTVSLTSDKVLLRKVSNPSNVQV